MFRARGLKSKEDWIGKWLERHMIGDENDWEGKWVWDNWHFKWSQKTQRWERGTSFLRVSWSLVLKLTKHKRCPLFAAFLLLCPPRLQSEELSRWWVSVIDGDYLHESDSLFLPFLCVLIVLSFFSERKTCKGPNHPKTKDSLNSSFLPTQNQTDSSFYKAPSCFVILMMIMIIMSPYAFIVLHAFQNTFTYTISFEFQNNSIKQEMQELLPC